MASMYFLISTLAILAAAKADCVSDIKGDVTAMPYHLSDVTVSGGSYTINLPDACNQLDPSYVQVGTQVRACSSEGNTPSITLVTLNTANEYSDYGARISSTIYCSYPSALQNAQSHLAGPGVGVGRHVSFSAQAHGPLGRPYAG